MHRARAHRQARSANRMECTATMRTPKSAERYLHSGGSRDPDRQSGGWNRVNSDWNASCAASFEGHVGVAEDVRAAGSRCDGCMDECYLGSWAGPCRKSRERRAKSFKRAQKSYDRLRFWRSLNAGGDCFSDFRCLNSPAAPRGKNVEK